jgi:transcriptional regulator with XRE-family HTH domain
VVIGASVPELSKEQRALRDALIDARVKANLTQRELASRIKRGQSIIGMIELGKRQVTVLELIQIAHALEADPVKLFAKIVRESDA